jgi:hypothetical protein
MNRSYTIRPIFRYGGVKNDTGSLFYSVIFLQITREKNDPKAINFTKNGVAFLRRILTRVTFQRRKMTPPGQYSTGVISLRYTDRVTP